jgi:hypothetical protein
MNRIITKEDESLVTNYDPIFVLPPVKYEEFVYQLYQPDSERVLHSMNRY